MHIKVKLQSARQINPDLIKWTVERVKGTPGYDLWNIPPVYSNHGQVSAPQHNVKWF